MYNFRITSIILAIIISFILVFNSSCSKEELTIEEKLVGFWTGDVNQTGNGILALTLDFQELKAGSKSGEWTTKSKDLSTCDTSQFNCSEFSCEGIFIYDKTENNTIYFSIGILSGPCWDVGTATVNFLDDKTIFYEFAPPSPYEDEGISGTFKKS